MATLVIRNRSGDFESRGFFGTEIRTMLPEIRKKYQDVFELVEDLNEHSQKCRCCIHLSGNEQQSLSAYLFARILNGVQAAYILSTYGLCMDARIILRSMLEALILLRKSAKEPQFAEKYLGADE